MKLIIQNARIAGTATDEYAGPDESIQAPKGFDITRMGEYVVVDGVASIPVPPPPDAQAMVTAIKAERDRRKFNGVKVGAQWLHTDTYSRTQWLGMVLMGASIPATPWATMDGTPVTTSQALVVAVFQGTAQLDAALFGNAKALIAQVKAADDPASVDITVGWPATFGEVS